VRPINAEGYIENKGYEFFTFDPQFQITGDFSHATYLRVFFSCEILEWTQGYQKREEELFMFQRKLEEQALKSEELQEKLEEQALKSEDLQAKSERIQSQLMTSLAELQTELVAKQSELQNVQNDLHYIKNQMKEHRTKSMIKVLMYGGLTRGKSGE
jgi:hypothetical protein